MDEPAWLFIEELQKPLHQQKPAYWQIRAAGRQELSITGGIELDCDFSDPAGLLWTALQDFDQFCQVMDLTVRDRNAAIPLQVRTTATDRFESFRLSIEPDRIILAAADTEGIRRGLVSLEEEIRAAGAPVLPLGQRCYRPHIRTRLSRCFFGPIKRPPMNRDELEDDINYYPDEYLNRLAHEGVNALWLTIAFRETVPSQILPGFGRRADVHFPKLRQTVARCARYGIRIFIFFIEPAALIDQRDNQRYLDIRQYEQDYPEIIGHRTGELTAFCPSSELARRFLYEAAHTLFSEIPGLGGMIDISIGERFTHCCSLSDQKINCPRCAQRQPRDVLADVLACLENGMHDANPQAEFISWPYSQYLCWGEEATVDAAGHVPAGVILQHNFESAGRVSQLGRMRIADDYWLSYSGPSELFSRCADRASETGTRMFAKLQVGCSHEVASVTHVPVPGILYEKYARMHELGVSGVMQSWYFGNYPSLMTRAAGRLSFEPFPASQTDFLRTLARSDWGPHTETVIAAWALFQKAYRHYPVYHVFGYYAPMHDGPVWPLYLNPVNKPLIPNWKWMPEYPEQGDRIGECLQDAFSLDEAIILCTRMQRIWHQGVKLLDSLEPAFAGDPERLRDINTARALGILFASGLDILRFYQLRESLADTSGPDAQDRLGRLRKIVKHEIERSRQLAKCCADDPALGFNSEHEGFRFYPKKLQQRVYQLQSLLQFDFPALENRIQAGQLPFPAYTGQEPDRPVYICSSAKGIVPDDRSSSLPLFGIDWPILEPVGKLEPETNAAVDAVPAESSFKAVYDENWLYLAITQPGEAKSVSIHLFPQRLWPDRTYIFDPTTARTRLLVRDPKRPPQIAKEVATQSAVTVDASSGRSTTIVLRIAFDDLQRPTDCRIRPLRINIKLLSDPADHGQGISAWVWRDHLAPRLAQSQTNPDEYGWIWFA